jgi:hypothetical protein
MNNTNNRGFMGFFDDNQQKNTGVGGGDDDDNDDDNDDYDGGYNNDAFQKKRNRGDYNDEGGGDDDNGNNGYDDNDDGSAARRNDGRRNGKKGFFDGFLNSRGEVDESWWSSLFDSSSIVSKVIFALMVVIVSVLIFRVGIFFLSWIYAPDTQPLLVEGLLSGQTALVIPQDASIADGVRILRSNNQTTGMEFTYSIWLNISDVNTDIGVCQHVFNKGTLRSRESLQRARMPDGIIKPVGDALAVMDSPGLYITRSAVKSSTGVENADMGSQAKLLVCMTTVDNALATVPIDNIPLKKWIHVIIRMQNTVMDVYVNGSVVKRQVFLDTIPMQSFGDIHICQQGGFSGNISNLQYFDNALSIFAIQTIVSSGPNMTAARQERTSGRVGNSNFFLASDWYTQRF